MLVSFIPSPSANGFHIGPLFIHAYGLAYVVAVTRRDHHHPAALGGARRQPRSGLRRRDLGLPRRDHRRPPVLPRDELEPGSAALVGAVRGLEGRPRDLGRDHARGDRRALARAPRRREHPAVHGRGRAGAARRAGDRPRSATTSTRSSSAARPRCRGALEISPSHRPAGYLQYAHLPADLPLRDHLGPRARRVPRRGSGTTAGSARRASSRSTSPATARFASSRRRCESTLRTTSSGCA